MSEKHYGMAINTARCFGCQTCVVSCKINNQIPADAYWCHIKSLDGDVLYQATGKFPNARLAFRPVLCMHCENPACVNGCPSGAMSRDAATGVVSVDQSKCIGCGYCVWNCPYEAPEMDEENNVMSKCDFCISLVEQGKQPYCVAACPGEARIFGDLNDPKSEVNSALKKGSGQKWMPEHNTNPSVYYI